MTMRLMPHAAAISEFVAGYHGDCGQCAELTALHPTDPTRFPLDAAALATIVQRDVAHGWASSNGSEPLSAIASDLAALGVPHTNHGYSEPFTVDYRAVFDQYGGIKPMICEFARAGRLPGDELNVAYHFNMLAGWDATAGAGLFADGDNIVERNGGTALVRYTLADLVAAGICGLLVVDVQVGGSMTTGVPAGWTDDGTTLKAPGGAAGVGTGFRAYILANGWNPQDIPVGPEVDVAEVEIANTAHGAGTVQYFRYSALIWSRSEDKVLLSWVGREAMVMRAQIATLDTQLASAQSNLQAAQAQRDALSAQLATAQAQITALQAQLAAAPQPQPLTPQQQALDLLGRALKTYLAS